MQRRNSINAFLNAGNNDLQLKILSVISLARLNALRVFFGAIPTLKQWNVHVLEGVDGAQQKELFRQSRLISPSALNGWSPGAVGSALSHMLNGDMHTTWQTNGRRRR